MKEQLPRDLLRLYQLIWKRFVASRMAAAVYETMSTHIEAGSHIFTMAASNRVFDGYMSIYTQEEDQEESNRMSRGQLRKNYT